MVFMTAILVKTLHYGDVISSGITSMDLMALTYCEENGIPGWSCFIVSLGGTSDFIEKDCGT